MKKTLVTTSKPTGFPAIPMIQINESVSTKERSVYSRIPASPRVIRKTGASSFTLLPSLRPSASVSGTSQTNKESSSQNDSQHSLSTNLIRKKTLKNIDYIKNQYSPDNLDNSSLSSYSKPIPTFSLNSNTTQTNQSLLSIKDCHISNSNRFLRKKNLKEPMNCINITETLTFKENKTCTYLQPVRRLKEPTSISDAVLQLVKVFSDFNIQSSLNNENRANFLRVLSTWCKALPCRALEVLTSFYSQTQSRPKLRQMSTNILDMIDVPLEQIIILNKQSHMTLLEFDALFVQSLIQILNIVLFNIQDQSSLFLSWMIQIQIVNLHENITNIQFIFGKSYLKLFQEIENYKKHYDHALRWALSNVNNEIKAQMFLDISNVKNLYKLKFNIGNYFSNFYQIINTSHDDDNNMKMKLFVLLESSLKFYNQSNRDKNYEQQQSIKKFLERWKCAFELEVCNITNSLSSSKTSLSSFDSPYSSLTSSSTSSDDCIIKTEVHSIDLTPVNSALATSPSPPTPPPPQPPPPPPASGLISNTLLNITPQMALPPPPPPPPLPPLSGASDVRKTMRNNFSTFSTVQPIVTPPMIELSKKPQNKMRTMNWSKLSTHCVMQTQNINNIWQVITNQLSDELKSRIDNADTPLIDFDELEQLFSLITPSMANQRRASIDVAGFNEKESNTLTDDPSCHDLDVTPILSQQRSLSVNVFLKPQKANIIKAINECNLSVDSTFGLDSLQCLRGILPTKEETEALLRFCNEDNQHSTILVERLPKAERFLYDLITEVKDYKLKIDFILLREEFKTNIPIFKNAIHIVKKAAEQIMSSSKIRDVLGLILISGNFLNFGGYASDALGFKISSLTKLKEVRANKNELTLLHYIVSQAEKRGVADFVEELSSLEEASKISTESLQSDIRVLDKKIISLKAQSLESDPKIQSFLNEAENTSGELRNEIESELEQLREKIAQFFCEDKQKFKLEECFQTIGQFLQQFRSATDDNRRREEMKRKNEEKRMSRSFIGFGTSSNLQNFSSFREPNKINNNDQQNDNDLIQYLKHDFLKLRPITNGNLSGSNIRRVQSCRKSQIIVRGDFESRDISNQPANKLIFNRNITERQSLNENHLSFYRKQNNNNNNNNNNNDFSEKVPTTTMRNINIKTNQENFDNQKFTESKTNTEELSSDFSSSSPTLAFTMNSDFVSTNPKEIKLHINISKNENNVRIHNDNDDSIEEKQKRRSLLSRILPSSNSRKNLNSCSGQSNTLLSPIDEICVSRQFSKL